MLKKTLLLLFISMHLVANAQREIIPTDGFKISGKVKKEKSFSMGELVQISKQVKIPDQIIYNHKGEIKDTLTQLKGVSLKTVLASVEYVYEKPKELNEFYLVCTASDGYKVVFSWNEIYNTENGNQIYFITEMDGKPLKELDSRIILIATSDSKSGRRFIKALEKIEVRRAE